tara:strand:+ start:474 stop:1910 length:1437 start_codon:yes stop_codon:yes gene_type:complete
MCGGGGGGSQPTETTVTNTDLPEYVEPYFKRLLQRGEADSLQGYTPYGGARLAYFSPDELTGQAMTRGYAASGTPQQYTDAGTALTGLAAYGDQGYTPGTFSSSYTAGNVGPTYAAGNLGPSSYAGQQITSGYRPETRGSAYTARTAGEAFNPLEYEKNLQRFMSPYQQNVTDIEKREAIRQSQMMASRNQDAAAASGGLGGYREAIMQSERQRNLGTQLGDIQTRGSQQAFQNAQAQLERERASQLGAAKFGLQQYTSEEQSRQQQERFAQGAYQASQQAKQQAAALGLNAQQQTEASRQAAEKYRQSAFQTQAQASQQAGAQRLQAYQAGERARAEAAKLGLNAQQQQEAANQAKEKFAQSAYDMSSRTALAKAKGLIGLGTENERAALSRIQALLGIGSQERALQQASLDMGYDDFLRQQGYSKEQLGFFSNLLRGVPVAPQASTSTFTQQPGLFQQALGAGLSGLGLYKGYGGG